MPSGDRNQVGVTAENKGWQTAGVWGQRHVLRLWRALPALGAWPGRWDPTFTFCTPNTRVLSFNLYSHCGIVTLSYTQMPGRTFQRQKCPLVRPEVPNSKPAHHLNLFFCFFKQLLIFKKGNNDLPIILTSKGFLTRAASSNFM